MQPRRTLRILAGLLLLVGSSPSANADSYAPPTPHTKSSPTGTFLVRTLPPVPGGKSDKRPTTTAIVYRLNLENQSYREISRFELERYPAEILINDAGTRIVTFDSYPGMGHGDRAIAVMDGSGKDLKTWKLTDIHPQARIDQMDRTVSSIFWRGRVSISPDDSVFIPPPTTPDDPFRATDKLPNLKLDLKRLTLENAN